MILVLRPVAPAGAVSGQKILPDEIASLNKTMDITQLFYLCAVNAFYFVHFIKFIKRIRVISEG